jgi:ERCC4-type nuclease
MANTPFTSRRAPIYANIPDEQWKNWRWQLSNRINTVEEFEKVIPLTAGEREALSASNLFRVDITPYFISLINPDVLEVADKITYDVDDHLRWRDSVQGLSKSSLKMEKNEIKTKFEITVDHRETSSTLVKELVSAGFKINLEQLPIADYCIGDRIYVERKTCQDFSKSIIDGRLFKEVAELKQNATHCLLVIEGEDLYTGSTLRPEAVRAAFISIMIDFNLPIIWAKNGKETAQFFTTIARRELERSQGKKAVRTRIEKAPENQENPRIVRQALDRECQGHGSPEL